MAFNPDEYLERKGTTSTPAPGQSPAFNPDEYLERKGTTSTPAPGQSPAFNPDDYLAQKGGGVPVNPPTEQPPQKPTLKQGVTEAVSLALNPLSRANSPITRQVGSMTSPMVKATELAQKPQLQETVKNVPQSAAKNLNPVDIAKSGYQVGRMVASGKGGEIIPAIVKDYKEKYGGVENIQKTVKEDPVRFLLDVTGIASLASLGRAAAKGATSAVKSAISPDIKQSLVRAIKPSVSNKNFELDIQRSVPVINAVAQKNGKVITNIDELAEAATEAKRTVWDAYDKILDEAQNADKLKNNVFIDGDSIAVAIEKNITDRVKTRNPSLAGEMQRAADYYKGKKLTPREADAELKSVNNESHSYYAKNPGNAKAAYNDPSVRYLLDEAEALRSTLYQKLNLITGKSADVVRKLYGSLTNIESEAMRRAIVANRQAPVSLQESINKPFAVARGIKGVITGNPADLAEAGAQIIASNAIKDLNTTNGLIKNAFEKFNKQKAKITPGTVKKIGKKSIAPTYEALNTSNQNNQLMQGSPSMAETLIKLRNGGKR